ncbi:tail assembly protein [Pantoea rwandensis]|uniref:Phage tail protein n=1 Tax=Pantoea rwandensis TaxID=1076550 RepID=A0A1X1CP24_9GAMM|nr:tail assembly protein [Pantoea rwandensis]ORM66132.1 phage tail protein [Pantoea rwandensis]
MIEMMTEIHLGGVLGGTFGRVHHRLISKVHEATIALSATIDGFGAYMRSSKKRGLTYAVFRGKQNLGVDDLGFPVTKEVIKIMPVIIGSKKAGLLQTVLGAVLVVVGVVVGVMTSWTGVGGVIGSAMVSAGIGLMAGGVIQMLSPQPAGLASKQDADNQASYAFGSPTNTAAQGYPVPLLYGQRRIGGAIISAGIYVEDQQ